MPCSRPWILHGYRIECGKCQYCRTKYAKEWSWRIQKELQHCFNGYFVTLTYDNDNLPWVDTCYRINEHNEKEYLKKQNCSHHYYIRNDNPDAIIYSADYRITNINEWHIANDYELRRIFNLYDTSVTLCRDDTTKWLKRLRKALGQNKLKYFYCGEYGSTFKRPHYHFILMLKDEPPPNFDNIIRNTWGKGIVDVQFILDNESVTNYCVKYIKKVSPTPIEGVTPCFRGMSKGIAKKFALENERYFSLSNFTSVQFPSGKKCIMPRFIRKLFNVVRDPLFVVPIWVTDRIKCLRHYVEYIKMHNLDYNLDSWQLFLSVYHKTIEREYSMHSHKPKIELL